MPVEDFITLCKNEIDKLITSEEDYDIFVVWKDFWTIGENQHYSKDLEHQRAIFGTTANNNFYDCTLNGDENKLYINIHTKTSSRTIDLNEAVE